MESTSKSKEQPIVQESMDHMTLEGDMRGSHSLRPKSLVSVAPSFYKDQIFWQTKLNDDEILTDMSSIDCLDFNPHQLDQLLVTSLARLSLYDSNNLDVIRTFRCSTQFQVYGGCFRKNDGRLIACGSEEGKLFVFDSSDTKPMRVINLRAPVHKTIFEGNNLVAFSDDRSVRIIDIGSGQILRTFGNDKNQNEEIFHKDYVRTGLVMESLIVSGSYDRTVKIWDPRQEISKPVFEFDHNAPVESICHRNKQLLYSVGGIKMTVFDLVAGKIQTSILPKHHKTITSVVNHENEFLLTGGLDGFLNVMNFNYEFITRFNYDDSQVLCTLSSPKLVAIGLNNHNVHLKKFDEYVKRSLEEQAELEKLQSGYFGPHMVTRYFHEAIAESQDPVATRRALLAMKQKQKPIVLPDIDCLYEPILIEKGSKPEKRTGLSHHERLLYQFQYTRALQKVLRSHKDDPDEITHILRELMKRNKLEEALSQCKKLASLINFISANLMKVRHNRILLDTACIVLDLIIKKKELLQENPVIHESLDRLMETLKKELDVIESSAILKKQVESVIARY